MAQQGTDPSADVVEGIVFIVGIRARTLFNTGASHSYISRTFARSHGFEKSPLPCVLF